MKGENKNNPCLFCPFLRDFKKAANATEDDILRLSDFNKRIIDSAPLSIITIDKNGIITFTNKYFKNFSSEVLPLYRSIFEISFFEKEGLIEAYQKLLKDGTPVKKDNCHTKNFSGKDKYINIVAVPLRDKNGNIDGALSMATDATEAVVARAELRELNDQLQERVDEKTKQLEKINQRLEKSLKVKSQFISDASHELRTPLAIAKLNLELFRRQIGPEDKDSKDVLAEIDHEINKVSDILSDISFFSAIDEESVEKISKKNILLNSFIGDLVERLRVVAAKKNIDIIFKKDSEDLVVPGDKMKLEKLFLNVIGNSIKYGKKSGWVKIKIDPTPENNLVKIVVEDNGEGISKKDLPHIFERFYRTKSSRSNGEGGFGLGLAICKWIAELHKGSIEADSAVGKGSTFTVTLPIK